MLELDQIFTVSSIFCAVGGTGQSFFFCVMYPGIAGTGKEESPPQSDGPQRIQFVGVENDPSLGGFRQDPVPVTVTPDSFRNSAAELFRQLFSPHQFQSHLCAALRMTYLPF